MSKIPVLFLLTACASAPAKKVDWTAVDAVTREARWRTERCVEPNSVTCDALWFVKDEIAAIVEAVRRRDAGERERACAP